MQYVRLDVRAGLNKGVFAKCTALISVTFPNSIISLGGGVFTVCTSLKKITYNGTTQEWESINKPDAFYNSKVDEIICTNGIVKIL